MKLLIVMAGRSITMEFGEKIAKLRKEKKLTQKQLAEIVGVTYRSIQNYETNNAVPRKKELYKKLAETLEVDINYLLSDEDEFVLETKEKYGNKGASEAVKLVSQVSGLFAGGDVDEDTKDEVMKAIQWAYWDAKERNKKNNR